MVSTREIISILVTADAKQAVRELDRVGTTAKTQLGAAEKASGKFTDRVKAGFANNAQAIGTASTVLAGFGAVAVTTTQKASDLEQAVGATEAVFGEAESAIAKFADTSADKFGLSERAARQLTAQFGGLLTNLGFTQSEAAETSIKVAKLGADLSAAFGGKPDEAVQALGAAMRGERDPIERYSVSIKEADVKARVLKLGLDTSTVAAEKNAKAVATLDLIYEQTASSQGMFNREQNTMAGTMARLQASFEDLEASIGEEFLPAMQDAAAGTKFLVDAMGKIPDEMKAATFATANPIGAFNELRDAGHDVVVTFEELNPAFQALAGGSLPRAMKGLAGDLLSVASGADDAAGDTDDLRIAQQKLFDQVTSRREKMLGLADSTRDLARSQLDAADAAAEVTLKQAEYQAAVDEFGENSPETQQALRDYQNAIITSSQKTDDAKQELIDYSLAQSQLNDGAGRSPGEIQKQIDSLEGVRDTLAPDSPLRKFLDDYIFELTTTLPDVVTTELRLDATMSQSFRDAMGMIGALIDAGLTPSQAGAIAATEFSGGTVPGRAHGGHVSAGDPYVVGEQGPELFVPGTSGMIVPNGKSNASGSTAGATVINLHVHALSADGPEIERVVTSALVNARRRGIAV